MGEVDVALVHYGGVFGAALADDLRREGLRLASVDARAGESQEQVQRAGPPVVALDGSDPTVHWRLVVRQLLRLCPAAVVVLVRPEDPAVTAYWSSGHTARLQSSPAAAIRSLLPTRPRPRPEQGAQQPVMARVVRMHGYCTVGLRYNAGDGFVFHDTARVQPEMCGPARTALRPYVQRLRAHEDGHHATFRCPLSGAELEFDLEELPA